MSLREYMNEKKNMQKIVGSPDLLIGALFSNKSKMIRLDKIKQ